MFGLPFSLRNEKKTNKNIFACPGLFVHIIGGSGRGNVGPTFINFMQFLGKHGQNNRFPHGGKSWIHHCIVNRSDAIESLF